MKKIFIPPVLLLISMISILLCYFFLPELNLIPFPFNLGGLVLVITGILLIAKAGEFFKKYKTSYSFEKATHLITEGIFLKTRNPVYLGMVLFVSGFAVWFHNLLALIVPFILFLAIRFVFIRFEEKELEKIFGKEYTDYKERVGRWFLLR
jgi:protein-S-isoprenylcysteine O-methyltransferase Ste14